MIGWMSDHLTAGGLSSADSLRQAMFWGLAPLGLAIVAALLACANLKQDEDSRLDRARLAGEEV